MKGNKAAATTTVSQFAGNSLAEVDMVSEQFKKWLDDPVLEVTVENSPHRLEMIRQTQDVIFDAERCANPGACLKCLKACGPHVLAFFPGVNLITKERMHSPKILLYLPEMCSACNRCVDVCPEKAVAIEVYGGRRDGA